MIIDFHRLKPVNTCVVDIEVVPSYKYLGGAEGPFLQPLPPFTGPALRRLGPPVHPPHQKANLWE